MRFTICSLWMRGIIYQTSIIMDTQIEAHESISNLKLFCFKYESDDETGAYMYDFVASTCLNVRSLITFFLSNHVLFFSQHSRGFS